jgi:hypothetical protein
MAKGFAPPLAPIPQECAKPTSHEVVLLSLAAQLPSQKGYLFRHAGLGAEPLRQHFRSGAFFAQTGPPFFDRNATEVRPLGSTGITPLPRYYGPLRLPTGLALQVMVSPQTLPFPGTPSGLPGSSTDLSTRALPNHPGWPDRSMGSLSSCRWQASPSPAGWPPPSTCNEAESGSLALGLASSLSGGVLLPSSQAHCLRDRPTPRVRLPCTGGRSYMLNEQLACPTPFSQIDRPGLAWRNEAHEGVDFEPQSRIHRPGAPVHRIPSSCPSCSSW